MNTDSLMSPALNNAHVTLPHSPSRDSRSIESTDDYTYVDNSNSSLKNIRSDEGNEVSMVQIEATQKTEENRPFLDIPFDIAEFPTAKLLEMLTALLDKIVKSNDKLELINSESPSGDTFLGNSDAFMQSVLSFRGKHIPQIGLDQYFQRIQKYCPITNDVFLSLLVYFDRISKKCNKVMNSSSHVNKNNDKENDSNSNSIDTNNDYDNTNDNINNNNNELNNNENIQPQQSQVFVMDSYNIHRLIIAGVTVSTKFFSDLFYSNSRYARVGGISLEELNHLELQFLILCDFRLVISVEELQRYADLLSRFWHNNNSRVYNAVN